MRVLITGAGGMLGRDVADACLARRHRVYAATRSELDITDTGAVEEAVAQVRADAVINCAAWTDVDGAEAHERAAMRVNDAAAASLAGAAEAHGAKILHLSSDYVFDGEKRTPYVESDLPAAISAYGRSKQAGETSVAIANPRHMIVRSSWLFGIGGGNFVATMLRIATEQPEVIVVSDQVGTPTYTPHLAAALAELVELDDYGIHHVSAAGECSWYDFAQEIFDQAGSDCRVMAGSTEMLGRPAPRPRYSVLGSERSDAVELPDWRRGLSEYLGALAARDAPGHEPEDVSRLGGSA